MNNAQADSFRSIDFWKTSIMTLPDNAFFELARTVFGKVKTPFNKQVLASELEKFLSRGDIQKNIASYIDGRDTRIVAAVAFLGEPSPGDLEAFFSGELSYVELNDLLINLEERFILYRFWDESKSQNVQRLALNPVFKSILLPFAADSSLLFPSIRADEIPPGEKQPNGDSADGSSFGAIHGDGDMRAPLLYDDRTPAMLLSFVSMNEEFFKSRGEGIRQKTLNSAKATFPGLPLETLVGALQVLGLLSARDDRLVPDYGHFSAFGRLTRQERAEYYTAGIFCFMESAHFKKDAGGENSSENAISPWLLRAKVRFYAALIHRLCRLLEPDRLYPFHSLQKLTYLLERGNSDFCRNKLIDVMAKTGLLVSASEKHWRRQPFAEQPAGEAPKAVIAMDASFSLMVYPEIEYGDLVKIAAFSHVAEASLNVRFEMNRDSVVSAFNLGLSADSIIELLQKLSHGRIDESLIYALRDWEKSHREVALNRGLVLTLSPERRYLAETKPLSTFIRETLAPGIYMLPPSLEDRAVRALRKAGVSIIAQRGDSPDENRFVDGGKSADAYSASFYPQLRSAHFAGMFPQAPAQGESPGSGSAACGENGTGACGLIESFRAMLKKMRVDKEKLDELTARIDRRLILCDSQLKDAVLRYEKLEARGLDYSGKILIAKQAINLQSFVEVTWPSGQKQERVVGIPAALEKTGSETVLAIKLMDGGEDMVRIPLGKISMLRRIKKSIFETTIA